MEENKLETIVKNESNDFDNIDLFADELDDRMNGGPVGVSSASCASSASSAGTSSASCGCCFSSVCSA